MPKATPYGASELAELNHEELIAHVLLLQNELDAKVMSQGSYCYFAVMSSAEILACNLQLDTGALTLISLVATTASTSASIANKSLSTEEIVKKVSQLRTLLERQIRKAMVWKPSCKTGSATFSQDFMVQSLQVFQTIFKHVAAKPFKQKKFSADEFQKRVVGSEIEGQIRYGVLVLTADVNCRYDENTGVLKVSGKYGKFGTGNTGFAASDDEKDQ